MMRSGAERLGLGTAQLGLDYGITNPVGRVAEAEAAAILRNATQGGIDLIDTAHLYGGSEEAIGRLMPAEHSAQLVTKTPKFGAATDADEAVSQLNATFRLSAKRLKRLPHGLLFHDPADLLGPFGSALWAAATELKAAGQVAQIGASIYDGAEIDRLLARFPLDLVQLPWNPLDPRLAEGGQLDRLRASGVKAHARSLFLQGLLLQEADRIDARFVGLREAVAELAKTAERHSINRLELILALAFREKRIDRFICGVTSATELTEIALAADRAETLKDFIGFAPSHSLDLRILNPARWIELQ